MKKIILILACLLITNYAYPQQQNCNVYDNTQCQRASFKGGNTALMQWLSTHIKYPTVAENNGIQGKVAVSFFVEKDGTITNPKIVKSVDPSLNKEALRLVKSMPRWVPTTENYIPKRTKCTVIITFKLS